jgi:hypothetical protein
MDSPMPAVLDTRPARHGGWTTAPFKRPRSTALVSLGGHYATARPVPNGRRTLGISTPDRRSQRLRRPRIAMRTQRPTAALLAREHGVEVISPDAVDVPDLDRRQNAALDPIADRLRGQLELLRDLIDREHFRALRCLVGHCKTQISKNSVVWYSLR